MNLVPLNIKTHYELLKSLINVDDLISFAKKHNIISLGITDTNMFDTVNFYKKCINNDIKPIIGISLKIDNSDIILYAKNYEGLVNLYKITTLNNYNSLTLVELKKYFDNIVCVINNNSIQNYNIYNDIFETTYISYNNELEKEKALNITNNIVYINESLCLVKEDLEYLKYLYMIKDGKTISDIKDYTFKDNYINLNVSLEDIKTTNDFINEIDIKLPKYEAKLPKYKDNSNEYLKNLCIKGLNKRLNNNVSDEYKNRLTYELSVIEKMGYVDYFLIVYDYVLYAKKNKIIVGPGRGSAAGSLVSYVLGITEVDPIKYDLIFERFLNPERITMPDIDCDFEYLRRDEVVDYVKDKYGHNKVANIITFGTLLSKQVIRDVGRVLEIPVYDIDKIVKYIKDKETLEELKNNKQFMDLIVSRKEYKQLFKIAYKLEGLKRHTSIHAAGVVISDEDLTNKMPLYKSGNDILTSFSMEYLEELGLLKMDFLALKNLTIIDNVIKLIESNLKHTINLNEIPLNDTKTLKLLNEVNTVGIFQLESNGMKSFLNKLKIKSFDDIVISLSLYRPGPRENIDTFIRRREGKEKTTYLLKELEPILKSTNGIMIYQEQILEVLRQIGGYSYAEADNIRRAMSKKKESIILNEKENFINRCSKKGIDKSVSNTLYNDILKFSNYGFNKSHAVSYAIISYYMAFLKAHYKEYFMANLLNTVIGSEIKIKEYIDECKILGIEVIKPNINISDKTFKVQNNKIICPLSIIKNVGVSANEIILEERKNGEYVDYADFISRVYGKSVNKKTIISLIEAGTLDIFNYNKNTLVNNLDSMIDYAELVKNIDKSYAMKPTINEIEEYNDDELLNKEYLLYGFYLSNHPVTKYKRNNTVLLKDIEKYFDKVINVIALVDTIKVINTKNGDRMSFIEISDEYKQVEAILFPKQFNEHLELSKGNIIKIFGKVEKRLDKYQLVINNIEILK